MCTRSKVHLHDFDIRCFSQIGDVMRRALCVGGVLPLGVGCQRFAVVARVVVPCVFSPGESGEVTRVLLDRVVRGITSPISGGSSRQLFASACGCDFCRRWCHQLGDVSLLFVGDLPLARSRGREN